MEFPDNEVPITPDRQPVHARPVPHSIEKQAKVLIQQLINENVLERIYESKMESLAFFLDKPTGSLRLFIDYRWLNKYLKNEAHNMYLAYAKFSCDYQVISASRPPTRTWVTTQGDWLHSRPLTALCLPFGKM